MRFLSEKFKKNKSFTLIEMVVVVGILAILTVVSISLMNPAENFRQSRDSQRISDLNNVNVAITKIKYSDKRLTQSFLGSTNVIYTSLPDQLTSCGNYNLPTPPTGWTYHCVDQSVLRKTDGTGWIPVNFDSIGADSGIISLPIDPSNNADDLTFYTYAIDSSGKYELSAYLESIKERARVAAKDGGSDDDYYEIGTSFALLNPQEASGTLVSALNSLVSASPLQASADNTELITITITAKDSLGNPISGLVATTSVTGSGNTITQPLFVTDSNGVATGTLKSSVGETKTISAIVDDVNIVQTVDVIFSPVYTTGSWVTDSSGGPTQGNGNSIAEVDGMIYVIAGNSQTFRKYNPSTKVWSNLADTPTGVGVGASLVKFNSNTIYFSSGNSVNFYKYTISTNVWSQMASMPAGVTSGGSLTYPGTGDLIYALQGANQKSFWQYSIANNCWSVYNNAQSWGNSIVEVDGILYVMNGSSQAFYKFEPTKNKWTQLLDVPAGVTYGASMVKITSNLIYASSGNSANFYKYTISSNTWTKMTNMPTSMTSGGSLAYPGTGDLIYALQGANQKSFWQYSIANNCWSVYNNAQSWGNSIVEVDGILYVMNGGSQAFYKFEPTKNKWTQLLDVPAGVTVGASMVKVSSDLIYASSGNSANFYKYTISANAWSQMTSMPAGVTSGGSLAYFEKGDEIFALRGANTNTMWKYSVSGNSWSNATNTPATIYGGGSVTSDGEFMYVTRGNNTTTFWKYSFPEETWTTLSSLPAAIKSGGSLTYDGSYVYATRGANTKTFYKYDISMDRWESLENTPLDVGYDNGDNYAKGGIAYSSTFGAIYVVSGNGLSNYGSIMKYDVSTNSWPMAVVAPDVVYGGGSLTALNSTTLYALKGLSTTTFWQYNISTGAWTTKAVTPAAIKSGGSLTSDGTYVYATKGSNSTDFYKYNPTSNEWSSLTTLPLPVGYDNGDNYAKGGISYSSSTSAIYVVSGNGLSNYGSIMKYDVSTNSWPMAVVAPDVVYSGGSLTALNSTTLYALKGNGTNTFWQYNISTGAWTIKATTPGLIKAGGSLTNDGTYVYATRGSNTADFYKYNPTSDSWSALTSTLINVGVDYADNYAKGGISYSSSTSAIYVVSGNGLSNYGSIMKYDVSTNSWPMAVVAPDVVYSGGSLTALNSTTLYALKGNGTNTFWQYNISTGAWTIKATTPGLIKAGGSLTNDGTYVYALRGSNTNDSYKYIPSSNQWSSMEATTIAVGVDSSDNYAKGGITFSSSTPGLFATSGSGTSIMKNSLTQ